MICIVYIKVHSCRTISVQRYYQSIISRNCGI